jgi:hypothetical protein
MKNILALTITTALLLIPLPELRAQDNAGASASSASDHPDEIVTMHQQVAAANREYKREVAAAKKVYDHKQAEAKKKRDAAVASAHQRVGQ